MNWVIYFGTKVSRWSPLLIVSKKIYLLIFFFLSYVWQTQKIGNEIIDTTTNQNEIDDPNRIIVEITTSWM